MLRSVYRILSIYWTFEGIKDRDTLYASDPELQQNIFFFQF